MPRYSYKCDKCGYKFDAYTSINSRNDTQKCEMCLGPANRDAETELNTSVVSISDHPRWSWAMGATPEVAKEMLQKHPDFEYKYGADGGPLLVKNRQDKINKMNIHGMIEY